LLLRVKLRLWSFLIVSKMSCLLRYDFRLALNALFIATQLFALLNIGTLTIGGVDIELTAFYGCRTATVPRQVVVSLMEGRGGRSGERRRNGCRSMNVSATRPCRGDGRTHSLLSHR
jgi:hypothetical protein